MFSYVVSCNGVGFVGEDFEKVELGGGVVFGEIVSFDRAVKLLFEDFVFDYVFGYFVGVSSCLWFGTNTPRIGSVVTEVLDVVFGGVIVYSGFVGAGRVN